MPSPCGHGDEVLAYHDCVGDDRLIHALVIGVGQYHPPARRYGTRLASLHGAALASYRFAHYLINEFQRQEPHGRRLATLRLMLSPMRAEQSLMGGLQYAAAERGAVSIALRGWAEDCDSDDRNLAVLYVAGHGQALGKTTSLFFLADAPAEASLALAAINLTVSEERMKACAAKDNLFVYDCCALAEGDIPLTQDGAMAVPGFAGGGTGRAHYSCINAARLGTQTFAIGRDGTLLSRCLLGDYAESAGGARQRSGTGDDALLRTAGQVVGSRFAITVPLLDAKLAPQIVKVANAKLLPAGTEPSIHGQWAPDPITVPEPTPEFDVQFTDLWTGRQPPITITLVGEDERTLTSDAADVHVERGIPAGKYLVEVQGSDASRPTRRNLEIVGPMRQSMPA